MLVSYIHVLNILYTLFSYSSINAMANGPKNNHGTYNCKYPDLMSESEENNVVDRLVKKNSHKLKSTRRHTPKVPLYVPNVANNHAKHLTGSHYHC